MHRAVFLLQAKAALPSERNIYTQETDNGYAFCLALEASERKDEN